MECEANRQALRLSPLRKAHAGQENSNPKNPTYCDPNPNPRPSPTPPPAPAPAPAAAAAADN